MKIKDICKCLVSDMVITFDEDPYHDCKPDIIIPVSADPENILAEGVLELEVNLMMGSRCGPFFMKKGVRMQLPTPNS